MAKEFLEKVFSRKELSDDANYDVAPSVIHIPSPHLNPVSPYLDYDPSVFQDPNNQYIFRDPGRPQRGRFELAFSQIGAVCIIGGAIGGVAGFCNGLISNRVFNHTGKARQVQLVNHVMKQGAGTANTFGAIAVIYSAFGVLMQIVRQTDDHINTVISATCTGLLFKSTAGLRKSLISGGIGLGVSGIFALYHYTLKPRLKTSSC